MLNRCLFILRVLVLSFGSLMLLFSVFTFPVQAQSPQPANTGVSVVPSIIQLDLSTDSPQTHVTYTNHTAQEIQLQLSASDFTVLEDGYKLSFLNQKDAQNYQYRLSSWISFNQTSLVLLPGEAATVVVSINPNELSPGAHYGTILAQIEQDHGDKTIQIQGILSSLLFVRTNTGREKEHATIQTFVPVQTLYGFPSDFLLRFNDTGETTLIPHGLLQIDDMYGRSVAKGILNEDSVPTLPSSIRRYNISVKKFMPILFPGMYHANFELHYGVTSEKLQEKVTFFSFGSWQIWAGVLAGVVFLGLMVIVILKRLKKSKD